MDQYATAAAVDMNLDGGDWDRDESKGDMVEMQFGGTEIRIRMAAAQIAASLAVVASGAMTLF